jgi:type I restriction-modification system DNA methylase subunit/restriction endonuclease S subunit
MIQTDNLKEVLNHIGFIRESMGEYYKREYNTCTVAVDFDNKKIVYPESKGLTVNDKTTSNFEHPENFVVLECVCRLLEKGYRPEHIELEPRWTLGHDAKGGKADILVKDNEGNSLLIIECKTAGTEFNKEKKNTEEDGGQLFSYWQQEISTRWLALYASDWNDDGLSYKCLVINCTDDANIAKMAEKDKDVKIYLNARNDKERFEVWEETYQKQWLDDVLFNEESQAYNIGIPPLRKKKLKDFTPEDRIVNRFEEILRHNNVSDKENAFNRLVALFICKLVDEIKKQDFDVVDFQYKQGQDTYESLQDRLQHLHQQGMEEFMKEKVIYVPADYADNLFRQYKGSQRKAAIEELKQTLRILKFYTNNDFAFKDVHNEELFYQNGKILVEVVQLFQPYRIVYPSKHQFLGDLFEQLLNKGFKQNEGQFFTPTPITRFIWDSLPLQNYINEHDLPRVIDYACGAGHFLTEGVEAINAVRPDGNNIWVEKHIYGIEKDYRLARVSKISMFMNGAGGSNIIFGDGLENYPEKGITPASFDILVANPPYAVKGFKQHLKLKNNTFSIIDKVSTDGDEIEMLFVERIAQLLKPKGIAAVVLPSSILNDTSSSGIAARENLLQNFQIRAIVAFGSQTFGATGTNTVTLFLERYNEPPRFAEMANDTVNGILTNGGDTDWEDVQILDAYIAHQKTEKETYLSFLRQELAKEDVMSDPYLKGYAEAFQFDGIKYPKKCTEEEKAQIRRTKFYSWALAIEKEKLYYFSLVYQQQTLVITAPSENKDQKDFLGYEWSNRKGQEGIKIKQPGGKLYNAENRFARGTLACAVRNSFSGATTGLPDFISSYAQTYMLKKLLDFSVRDFNKVISLSARRENIIVSKYPLKTLQSLMLPIDGNQTKITKEEIKDTGTIPVVTQEVDKLISGFTDNAQPITDVPLIVFGDHSCTFKYIDFQFVRGADGTQLIKLNDEVEIIFVCEYLKTVNIENSNKYERHFKYLKNTQIPIPPIQIQQKIIAECKKVDEEVKKAIKDLEDSKDAINAIILPCFDRYKKVVLNSVCDSFEYGTSEKSSTSGVMPVLRMGNIVDGTIDWNDLVYTDNEQDIEKLTLHKGDVLFNRTNSPIHVGKTALYEDERSAIFAGYLVRVNYKKNSIRGKYLSYILNSEPMRQHGFSVMKKSINQANINASLLGQYDVPLPSLKEQDEIISKLEIIENIKKRSRLLIDNASSRKQVILESYLK